MKKRIVSLILAGVMLTFNACSGGGAQQATGEVAEENESLDVTGEEGSSDEADAGDVAGDNVLDYEYEGMKFKLTTDFDDLKGVFYDIDADDISDDNSLYYASFYYVAMPQSDYDALMEDEDLTDEEINEYQKKFLGLAEVWGVRGGDTPEKAYKIMMKSVDEEDMEESEYSPDSFKEVGKAGDVTYYYVAASEESSMDGIDDEFKAEYEKLFDATEKVISEGEFSEPVVRFADVIGKKLSFETTDLDGNAVKSEELFASHDVTMLNVWATWCGFCVEEIPQLQEINERLADKNCAIAGILGDAKEDGKLEEGKKILEDSNASYLNLVPWDSFEEDLDMSGGWPTSFFVDSEGTIVGKPIVGADVEAYEKAIDALLADDTGEADAWAVNDKNTRADSENSYRIIVKDETSAPVKGAKVQFCSDEACFMGGTGADGVASFDNEPGEYTVHILAVPDGYEKDSTEYKTPDTYSDINVVLKKK